jgi:hypothetical protein
MRLIFSDPFQIDSSAYFLVPRLVENDNQQAYGKEKVICPGAITARYFFTTSLPNKPKTL